MSKGCSCWGHCCMCGDQNGPWSWFNGIGWLCDECAEKEDNKNGGEVSR